MSDDVVGKLTIDELTKEDRHLLERPEFTVRREENKTILFAEDLSDRFIILRQEQNFDQQISVTSSDQNENEKEKT